MRQALILALLAGLVLACDNGPTDIDDEGVVVGIAYVDHDGGGTLTVADAPVAGVVASLLLDATGDVIASATSKDDGSFTMTGVPAGRYRLTATRGTAGDTLDVLHVDPTAFTVAVGDTAVRLVRLGYSIASAAAVRLMPSNRRVTVNAIALNGWATFGDSTLHVQDATGALRAVRVPPTQVSAGDSVQLVGTTGLGPENRLALVQTTVHVISAARGLPPIDLVTTGEAATADGGTRADGQVRVAGAAVIDTARVAGDLLLTVDDGSGPLVVVLDRSIQFDPAQYVPGATFDGAGVLAPAPTGSAWRLKPRERNEVTISFPTVLVSAARAMEVGRRVAVEGIALTGWATFGDSTVHLLDPTGSIRAVRVTGNVAAGDSVRLLGTIDVRDGQPVLSSASATVLDAGVGVPQPDSVPTSTARSAAGGTRDAGQVRVGGTVTGSQTLPSGDLLLTVNDGSGPLDVVFDVSVSRNPGPYVPGALLRAAGVLVPTGSGTWQLKPRGPADATATYPTLTVAQARAAPVGQSAYIVGIALNGWATFGDSTVHLRDGTGAIRTLRMPSATVFAGDSIQILGTADVRNGQPVMRALSVAVLLTGVGTGAPDSMTTQTAATAGAGARDADQAAVSGTISSIVTEAGTADLLLTINDGSGNLVVRLDRDVFPAGAWMAGDSIRARGLLVPNAAGTAWQLKPRTVSEVVKN
ncbi:MAG TPA: carboxypeptidase-like regulatory domain-containing protein [Longimicrobiales bacterium]